MGSGKGNCAIFSKRVACRTVSNALLKSKATRYTKGQRLSKIILRRPVKAAVVDPEGLKVNWSWSKMMDEVEGEERGINVTSD